MTSIGLLLSLVLYPVQDTATYPDGPDHTLTRVQSKQGGKLVEETWSRRPNASPPSAPEWVRSARFDARSGELTETRVEVYDRAADGGVRAGYRITTPWSTGRPGTASGERWGEGGQWATVSYRIVGPSLVALRTPFSMQVLEVSGRQASPLAEGSVVLWDGLRLPVQSQGRVLVPFHGEDAQRVRFDFQVFPACSTRLPVTWPGVPVSFAAEAVPRGEGAASVRSVSPVVSFTGGVRLQGSNLSLDWTASLDGAGRSIPLRMPVGSPFELVFVDQLPYIGTDDAFTVVAKSPSGATTALPQTVRRPDFKVDHQRAEYVGRRGSYTFTSNTDGFMRITGGEAFIDLDERVFAVEAGKPKTVGYTGKQVGVYEVFFDLTARPDEQPTDPEVRAKCGEPRVHREQDKNVVEIPVELKDADGKGVQGDCEVCCVHRDGADSGKAHCDKNGKGVARFEFSVNIDLTNLVGRVLNVPGRRVATKPEADDCCIKEITVYNDTDLPLYYRIYTAKTKTSPRHEFMTTRMVPAGSHITVTGDFGHCVRIAALRNPVPFDDSGGGVVGLVSDREYCCHRHGEEEFWSSFEGLRLVTIESGPCQEEPPPPTPPTPEPPKPPPVRPWEWPKIEWKWEPKWFPGPTYPLPGDEGIPFDVVKPPVTSRPPDEVVPAENVEGEFEPIQSVWQDDTYFDDQPGKQIRKTGPTSYVAELDMVADKPTLVGGQRQCLDGSRNNHYDIEFRGDLRGTNWANVKLRVTLSQGGSSQIVYESAESVDYLPVLGPPGPKHSFRTWVYSPEGRPETGSAYRPFKIEAGAYSLTAELVTMDGKPTGIAATVTGRSVVTRAPTLYFMPAFFTPRTPEQVQRMMTTAVEVSRATALWGPTAYPIADKSLPCIVLPPFDLTKLHDEATSLGVFGWVFSKIFSDPTKDRERALTDAYAAAAANILAAFSHMAGNGKVIAIFDDDDFDRTVYKSSGVAAFTMSQKAIAMNRGDSTWMTVLHETVHASPFLWSVDQMNSEFGQQWHNTPLRYIAEGIRIYGFSPLRQRLDASWPMMGPATLRDNSLDRWITQGTYKHLLDYFQTSHDPDTFDFSGVFVKTDKGLEGRLSPVYTTSGFPDPPAAPSPYTLVVKDKAGKALATLPLHVSWESGDLPYQRLVAAFSLRAVRPPGAVAVELRDPGGVLDTRVLGTPPPVLTLTGNPPVVSDADRRVTLQWSATATGSAKLLYSVLFSPDGRFWAPAVIEQAENTATFDLNGVLSQPQVKIVATDGSSSTELTVRCEVR